MLRSEGFPPPIGGAYRLDALMAWENGVLSGELPGVPDASPGPDAAAPVPVTELPVRRNTRRKRAA